MGASDEKDGSVDFGYDVCFGISPFMISSMPANFWAEGRIGGLVVDLGGRSTF